MKIKKMNNNISPSFKISIESHGETYGAELNWDSSVDEIIPTFCSLLYCAGFQKESIVNSMIDFLKDETDQFNLTNILLNK